MPRPLLQLRLRGKQLDAQEAAILAPPPAPAPQPQPKPIPQTKSSTPIHPVKR